MNKQSLSLIFLFALIFSCKIDYSFTGASIAPDVKTFSIKTFQNFAPLASANLSQTFTEALKDVFISQTSLKLLPSNGDLTLEGSITGYTITPNAIQGDQTAATNRLTITVDVKFINTKNEKQNFESSFSRFADYETNLNLTSIEDNLIKTINEQLTQDIFNRAVSNW
ncbi:MAG: hypothetical protein K0B10_00030 [Vicingaceae bacterium]|nr:hypothetical protein [Vicingaceae bacterium]